MRLIPTTPAAAFPVADRSRDGELYETEHPRLAAIRYLREAIAADRAGVDAYDASIFLLDPLAHERVWARSVIELTGLFVGVTGNDEGGLRYRMILEADVRSELGLDQPGAPFLDEALASRRSTTLDLLNDGLRLLDDPDTPVLRSIADARDAQRRMRVRQMLARRVH